MIKKVASEIRNFVKDYIWFVKESSSFKSISVLRSAISIPEFIRFERLQRAHRNMTPEQREAWYLSGEGRTLEL